LLRPGIDAARNVDRVLKAEVPQVFGGALAATAVVAEEQQGEIARQRVGFLWKLAKWDVKRGINAGDFQFVWFAHINEERGRGSFARFAKEGLGFSDADFERGGGVLSHGQGRELREEVSWRSLEIARASWGRLESAYMMRCLGIDYGTRRIGLSYGDEVGVATPLPALVQAEAEARWTGLERVVRERRITDFVLGYPYNMDGTVGFKAREVDQFAEELRARFGLPVHLVDERLTSYEAESEVQNSKRSARAQQAFRASGVVDSRAATLILQDFLNQRVPQPVPELEFYDEEVGYDRE